MTGDPSRDPDAQLLRVENLRVGFGERRHPTPVVKGVSFSLAPGRCVAIVGESGSGKSVTVRTLVGLTGGRAHVEADRLEFGGRDLLGLDDRRLRQIRGAEIGFVLQDALVSLDQLRPVGREIGEALRLHRWGDRRRRAARTVELLEMVGVPEPEVRARQRPFELSGGLRQRALIATALALDPRLVIADEPTTALDVTVQAQVLDQLEAAKRRGTALIVVSHDLAVVSRLADRVAVMRDGEILEYAAPADLFARPRHGYTRALIEAIPSADSRGKRLSPAARTTSLGSARRASRGDHTAVIEAEGLVKRYRGPDHVRRTVVDGVSFTLPAGRTLGIVGESGSGKTTTARLVLALTAPDGGRVRLGGEPWSELPERARRGRRRQLTAVYQDPLSSFDPRWSVEQILTDALPASLSGDNAAGRRRRVGELLELVGLADEHRRRQPLELSGGQRQRVAIARALAPEPRAIVCDEPVSALDVSIQAQVLDLLADLQSELGVSYLFISHDLGVIHHVSHDVLVMTEGRVVEHGSADDVLLAPQHPYTQRLVASLPALERPAAGAGAAEGAERAVTVP